MTAKASDYLAAMEHALEDELGPSPKDWPVHILMRLGELGTFVRALEAEVAALRKEAVEGSWRFRAERAEAVLHEERANRQAEESYLKARLADAERIHHPPRGHTKISDEIIVSFAPETKHLCATVQIQQKMNGGLVTLNLMEWEHLIKLSRGPAAANAEDTGCGT